MQMYDDLTTPTQIIPVEKYGDASYVFRGLARDYGPQIMKDIRAIEEQVPFRHMTTPNGFQMSVAITNCGRLGWISGKHEDYRYGEHDLLTGKKWPAMPRAFYDLATAAARKAGFNGFNPNSCIINRYVPGAKLGLHQDSDELDYTQPVVSVSLGLPAIFLLGGNEITDPIYRIKLESGDVVVWGAHERMRFHGIEPVEGGSHSLTGEYRYNLSIRVAD